MLGSRLRRLPALLALLLAAACGTPEQAPPPPDESITIAMTAFPDTMFGAESQTAATFQVLSLIQPPCFTSLDGEYQPVCFTKIPAIADGDARIDKVTVDSSYPGRVLFSDGTTTTLHLAEPIVMEQLHVTWTLRPNLRWEDGTPLTAHDFVFAAELYANPATRTSRWLIDNTVAYEAPDDRTLVWHGVPGYGDATYFLNALAPEPKHLLAGKAPGDIRIGEYGREALAYGPYKVQTFERRKAITLVPNPHYWRAGEGLPRIKKIRFKLIEDPAAIIDGLERGEIDVVGSQGLSMLEIPAIERLVASGVISAHYVPSNSWEHIDFGLIREGEQEPLFAEQAVRQSAAYGIDRQALIDREFAGKPTLMHSYILPSHWAYLAPERGLNPYRYDPELAAELLSQAGWRRGADGVLVRDGRRFSAELLIPEEYGYKMATAKLIQEQLGGLGMEIKIVVAPFETDEWPNAYAGHRFDLAMYGWVNGLEPPLMLFVCEAIPFAETGYQGQNYPGYCNPAFDEMVHPARISADRPRIRHGLLESQRIFNEDLPVLPLYQHITPGITSRRVDGLAINPTHPADFWNIDEWTLRP